MSRTVARNIAWALLAGLVLSAGIAGCRRTEEMPVPPSPSGALASPLVGRPGETYYMVTFLSGAAYWKGCYKGFEDARKLYGVHTEYQGTDKNDPKDEVTVFEQLLAKKPAGIAVSCKNAEAFKDPINKALAQGVKVLTFDADSPESNRLTFLCANNFEAGAAAADALAKAIGGKGEIVHTVRPGQSNVMQRVQGFVDRIKGKHTEIKIVQSFDGEGDQAKAEQMAGALIARYPGLKGMFVANGIEAIGAATAVEAAKKDVKIMTFDADEPVLDLIREGKIYGTVAQNTYSMGYWGLSMLFHTAHGLVNPISDWKTRPGASPLPPYVNTGIDIVVKDSAKDFYLKD